MYAVIYEVINLFVTFNIFCFEIKNIEKIWVCCELSFNVRNVKNFVLRRAMFNLPTVATAAPSKPVLFGGTRTNGSFRPTKKRAQ